jgi:predicted HAD superfamily Cof-like phosphohydrolase
MSKDWVQDIREMHTKYGQDVAVENMTNQELMAFFEFRIKFLKEEIKELCLAKTPEDAVDAWIDLCVVAISTAELFQADCHKAWDEVHRANMTKVVGVKASRPNPNGMPDLIKPDDFMGPNHEKNVGLLKKVFDKK